MTPATASARTEAPKNRYPGPCAACNVHVRAWSGTRMQTRPGAPWLVYCAAHSGDASGPSRASNDAPALPPSGDAPRCSERAAMAAIALYRHAVDDKRAPGGGEMIEIVRELAALAVWRCGSGDAARALADVEPVRSPALAAAADELMGELLGRIDPGDRTREESYVPVSNADAAAVADALVGSPVDTAATRVYAPAAARKLRGAQDTLRPVVAPAPAKAKPAKAGRWAHRVK